VAGGLGGVMGGALACVGQQLGPQFGPAVLTPGQQGQGLRLQAERGTFHGLDVKPGGQGRPDR
jgi:hypothetical protein